MQNKKNFLPMLALMGMTALASLAPIAPLAAQEPQPGVAAEDAAEQEMAQPAGTADPSSLTLTGKVVALDEKALRVETATGIESVVLTNQTTKPADLQPGDQVAVDFTNSSQGLRIATRVREVSGAAGAVTGEPAGQPMSGSNVMGHAGQSGTTADTTGTMADDPAADSSTGAMATETGDPVESTATLPDPRAGSAAPIADVQPLDQTGSVTGATGTMADSGSTIALSEPATTPTYGSTPPATGAESGLATATETASQYADADTTYDSDSLPATGSELPLAGLAGLAALTLAFALRARR